MPPGFTIRTNELAESRAELWLPLRIAPGVPTGTGMGGFLNVVGRLAPGITIEQAQADIALIARRLEENHPSFTRNWSANVVPLHEATVRDVRLSLLVLFGATGILLLIACANVANLFLSRAATRQAELAVRLSLGATAGRLLRQFLTESFVLAAVGGTVGVPAGGVGHIIPHIHPARRPRRAPHPRNWRRRARPRRRFLPDNPHGSAVRTAALAERRAIGIAVTAQGVDPWLNGRRPKREPPRKPADRLGDRARLDPSRRRRTPWSQRVDVEPDRSGIPANAGPHATHHASRVEVRER